MTKDVFLAGTEPAAETGRWGSTQVVDLGLGNRCAWASAKTLLEQLIEGRGEVAFGEFLLEGYRLPTLDLYLDDPSRLKMPQITKTEAGEIHTYAGQDAAVGLFSAGGTTEEKVDAGLLLATKDTGLVASVYAAFVQTVETLAGCEKAGFGAPALQWAWSTTLLAPLCDDAALTKKRRAAAAQHGSLVHLWMRHQSDDAVLQMLKGLPERGEVRVQNLATANTTRLGRFTGEGCAEAFGILG